MHTIIHPTRSPSRHRTAAPAAQSPFRKPMYDCQDEAGTLKLVVYVPGVDAAGVCIEARGPDLLVTARKTHFVRVNWQALHLEGAQRDYRLRLRLGRGFAYEAMRAEISHGVLTLTLPSVRASERPAANVAA
jgi:HSP20 family molecular chaperone IbpA